MKKATAINSQITILDSSSTEAEMPGEGFNIISNRNIGSTDSNTLELTTTKKARTIMVKFIIKEICKYTLPKAGSSNIINLHITQPLKSLTETNRQVIWAILIISSP